MRRRAGRGRRPTTCWPATPSGRAPTRSAGRSASSITTPAPGAAARRAAHDHQGQPRSVRAQVL